MKKIKSKVLGILTLSCSINAFATGIPVVDAVQNAQSQMEFVQKAAHWAKQIAEYQKSLDQLKDQTTAITGFKGITSFVDENQVKQAVTNSFDKILRGEFVGENEGVKSEFLGDKNPCDDYVVANEKEQCNINRELNIANVAHIQTSNTVIEGMMTRLTEYSQKIQTTTDMKSIAELEAAIAVESNSIQLLS